MKKFMFLLLLLYPLGMGEASPANALEGAWLQDGTKWTNAPPDINPHLQSGWAVILYFGKDRSFSLIYCVVGRVPKEYMTISHGDPLTLYSGRWEAEIDGIAVEYRLVSRTVPAIGERLPGPMHVATIKNSPGVLTFEGKMFRREVALDKSAAEAVYGVSQSSRNAPEQKGDALPKSQAGIRTTPPDTLTTR
jgi:hypothetical protein